MVLVFLFYPTTLGLLIGSLVYVYLKILLIGMCLLPFCTLFSGCFHTFSFLSSFALFSYDLMAIFSVIFRFLFLFFFFFWQVYLS